MDDEDYLFQVLESDRLPTLEEDRGWIHQRLVRQLRGGAKKARQAYDNNERKVVAIERVIVRIDACVWASSDGPELSVVSP